MITLNEQIDASKEMLIAQGLEKVEAEYFEKLCRGFTQKSVGLLMRHFPELLKLARKVREDDSVKNAKYKATITIDLDVTDINILSADYTIGYSRGSVKDSDGDREKVGDKKPEADEKEESEDLGDLPTPAQNPDAPAGGSAEAPEPEAVAPDQPPADGDVAHVIGIRPEAE